MQVNYSDSNKRYIVFVTKWFAWDDSTWYDLAIKVGSTVQIAYEGEIDEANTIDSAISASEVTISGGDVLIPA